MSQCHDPYSAEAPPSPVHEVASVPQCHDSYLDTAPDPGDGPAEPREVSDAGDALSRELEPVHDPVTA